ncbi:MAG: hypothetical protein KA765_04730 [Thermoflexales bacterium]|nr:hypothetical protein [Thermoflexales bacterium]
MPRLIRKPLFLATLLMSAATLLAYGDALRLPFFFDDMTHYVWLRGQTLLSIFIDATGRPYYRPLQFFLWKLYETLTGVDTVVGYHALSLLVHAIDAVLVVLLIKRLTHSERWWPAITAGLIFALFPFSYQVVTLPASFTHPMVALFMLLTVLAYDAFRTSGRRRWIIAALICGLLAFGSNEGSLLLAGLIVLVEWLRPRVNSPAENGNRLQPVAAQRARFNALSSLSAAEFIRRWRWVAVFGVMAALYFVWYQSRPHETSNGFGLRSVETIIQNAIYALQGLTFPLQPLGRVLMVTGLTDQLAVLIIAVPSLLVLAILFALTKRFKHYLFGAGWFVVCLTPPVLILSHDYFINAPRVLYLASIGAAWLWALAIERAAGVITPIGLRRALTIACVLLVLAPSFIFIRQRMDLHNLNAAPLNVALDVAAQSPTDAKLLYVNLPAWISTPDFWYPIGHEGALFMPSYSTMADFVSTNLNRPSQAVAVEFNSLSTPQLYYYGVYGPALGWDELAPQVRQADRVYFTTYAVDKIDLIEAGRVTNSSGGASPNAMIFGDVVVLQKSNWSICAQRLQVRLNWRALREGDWHVFVQLLKPDGTLAAQHDSPPMMGLYPFWKFQKGDQVEDVHSIDLSTLPLDQAYTLVVGAYDPANGERLTPTLPDGTQPADQAVRLGAVTIGAETCRR